MRTVTPEHVAAVQALIDQIAEQLNGAPHNVVLDALLAAYRRTAVVHGCCTASAGLMCQLVGADLLQIAQGLQAQPGTAVH